MTTSELLTDLQRRGLLYQCTVPVEELAARFEAGGGGAGEPSPVYCGFDPTADSLHVGHLSALLNLERWQRAGHKPLAVAGGGTGFIGDPSGRSAERNLLSRAQLDANLERIAEQLRLFLDFSPGPAQAETLNNLDWLGKPTALDFLRDIGKHFTVNRMLEKESVRARLEDRDSGLSFTEFSYMLLQATDFLHLFDTYGCRLQIGGSDQYGNITAGVDLIRRKRGKETFGLTSPLITRADGRKFGKTEEGAVWLSRERTSPYAFYQYWINVPDADAGRFLRFFTDLSLEEIEDLEKQSAARPEARLPQRTLARLLTERVHGAAEREKAEKATAALFGKAAGEKKTGGAEGAAVLAALDEAALLELVKGAPSSTLPKAWPAGEGVPVVELMAETSLWKSRGEARRAIKAGGAYCNGERLTDVNLRLKTSDLLHGKYLLLRKGKRSHHLLRFED